MKEIIGDDYPTYEDSVNMTLAEREDLNPIVGVDANDNDIYLSDVKKNGMYLDENNTWRMDCGCTEANVLDGNHNVCNKETDKDILLSRVLHRLACIEHDIKIVRNHINRCCKGSFFEPSLNEDGSVFADEAWHNISNIEIACDLNSNESLDWESRIKNKIK